ncbi:MAG: ferritin, partial [Hydrogenophilales bacterium 17-61-76]
RALKQGGPGVAAAFAKIGFLMASSSRSDKALHPTNLHVNVTLFPLDTVQSRMPNPEWLEHWLDEQIRFDETWENKVVGGILRNLSNLLGQTFTNVRDLNRYRKQMLAAA